tara:strand:- start:927 stop:1094 length:168 start_codon:yes stop_codon:yes gene_type:complete
MWILDILIYVLAFVGVANIIIRFYPTPKANWNIKLYDFIDYLSLRKGVTIGRRKK